MAFDNLEEKTKRYIFERRTLQLKLSSLYRCAVPCPCSTNIICPLYILSVGFIDVEIIGKEKDKRYCSFHLDISSSISLSLSLSPFLFFSFSHRVSTRSHCYYNYCFLVDDMPRRNLWLMVDQE